MCVVTTVKLENNTWGIAGWTGHEVNTDKASFQDERTARSAAQKLAESKNWFYCPNRQFIAVRRGALTEVVVVTLPDQASETKINAQVIKRLGLDWGIVMPVSIDEANKEAASLAKERNLHYQPLFFEAHINVGS